MEWLNVHGMLIMILLMVPNILYALDKKHSAEGNYHNKAVEVIEQIGRIGSMLLMIVNLPLFTYGYWFNHDEISYKVSTGILTLLYWVVWFFYFKKPSFGKAMALALIPTFLFLLSGILLANIPLVLMALTFCVGHCMITYHNNIQKGFSVALRR